MNELTTTQEDCSPRYLEQQNLGKTRVPDMKLIGRIYRLKGQTICDQNNFKLSDSSETYRKRCDLVKWFEGYEDIGYKIYHLTVTYKETEGRAYEVKDIQRFFEKMYLRYFLKLVVGSHYNIPSKRTKQPITLCFIDEHESLRSVERFADRLHVHAMIAAHPDTVDSLDSLVGENTLDRTNQSCKNIMTTCLEVRNSNCLLYASKMMCKYPDFLCFGGAVGTTVLN